MYGQSVDSNADLPLHDSDPEATLPFRAVVAVPGQEETVDTPPAPRLQDPARVETRDELDAEPGTLPFGTVLPLAPPPAATPSPALEPETVSAPPPREWIAAAPPQSVAGAPPPPAPVQGPPTRVEPGAILDGFEITAALGADPLGQWWSAVHGQFGPCLVLVLDTGQAAAEGPRLLIAVRVSMGVPPDPRLELAVGSGAVPRPWVAIQNLDSSPLDEILARGARLRPLRWALDLAGGLAALHAYGVAHGEVSLRTAHVPSQGAARWSRIALRTKAGPPEALPSELKPGATPTRGGDVHAFGAVLEALAPHVEEPWRARPLAELAQELRSDARPKAAKVLEELTRIQERPRPTLKASPWLWGLGGGLVGALVGALVTWFVLTTG